MTHANAYHEDIVEITFVSEEGQSETITATDGHPFWVGSAVDARDLAARPLADEHAGADAAFRDAAGGRYVRAGDLKAADQLLLRDGRSATVTGLLVRHERLRVYNLTVLRLHNYAVGEAGVLSHNVRFCGGAPHAKGRRGSQMQRDRAAGEGLNHKGSEVTVEFTDTKGTLRSRVDNVFKDGNRNVFGEAKNGPSANLTPNQRRLQDHLANGGTVTPVGQRAIDAGFAPGRPEAGDYRVDRFGQ